MTLGLSDKCTKNTLDYTALAQLVIGPTGYWTNSLLDQVGMAQIPMAQVILD